MCSDAASTLAQGENSVHATKKPSHLHHDGVSGCSHALRHLWAGVARHADPGRLLLPAQLAAATSSLHDL